MDMRNDNPPPTRETTIRTYEYFSLGALLVVLLLLFERGCGLAGLVPFLVGLGGIAARWRLALPMLLLSLVFAITDQWLVSWTHASSWQHEGFGDWLLCAALLGYAAAQLRLQGVARSIVPPDPRLRGAQAAGAVDLKGPGRRADYFIELLILGTSLAVWAALAPLVWQQLPASGLSLGLPPRIGRLLVFAWLLVIGLVVVGSILAYLSRDQRSRQEAIVFLQDLFWRETRGEQRRLFRWLAWRRMRRDRRRPQ